MEAHAHKVCGLWDDPIGGDSVRYQILYLHWCFWLVVSQSNNVVWMGTDNFALMKSAPNSVSSAELITALITCEILRMAPLFCGTQRNAPHLASYLGLGEV